MACVSGTWRLPSSAFDVVQSHSYTRTPSIVVGVCEKNRLIFPLNCMPRERIMAARRNVARENLEFIRHARTRVRERVFH